MSKKRPNSALFLNSHQFNCDDSKNETVNKLTSCGRIRPLSGINVDPETSEEFSRFDYKTVKECSAEWNISYRGIIKVCSGDASTAVQPGVKFRFADDPVTSAFDSRKNSKREWNENDGLTMTTFNSDTVSTSACNVRTESEKPYQSAQNVLQLMPSSLEAYRDDAISILGRIYKGLHPTNSSSLICGVFPDLPVQNREIEACSSVNKLGRVLNNRSNTIRQSSGSSVNSINSVISASSLECDASFPDSGIGSTSSGSLISSVMFTLVESVDSVIQSTNMTDTTVTSDDNNTYPSSNPTVGLSETVSPQFCAGLTLDSSHNYHYEPKASVLSFSKSSWSNYEQISSAGAQSMACKVVASDSEAERIRNFKLQHSHSNQSRSDLNLPEFRTPPAAALSQRQHKTPVAMNTLLRTLGSQTVSNKVFRALPNRRTTSSIQTPCLLHQSQSKTNKILSDPAKGTVVQQTQSQFLQPTTLSMDPPDESTGQLSLLLQLKSLSTNMPDECTQSRLFQSEALQVDLSAECTVQQPLSKLVQPNTLSMGSSPDCIVQQSQPQPNTLPIKPSSECKVQQSQSQRSQPEALPLNLSTQSIVQQSQSPLAQPNTQLMEPENKCFDQQSQSQRLLKKSLPNLSTQSTVQQSQSPPAHPKSMLMDLQNESTAQQSQPQSQSQSQSQTQNTLSMDLLVDSTASNFNIHTIANISTITDIAITREPVSQQECCDEPTYLSVESQTTIQVHPTPLLATNILPIEAIFATELAPVKATDLPPNVVTEQSQIASTEFSLITRTEQSPISTTALFVLSSTQLPPTAVACMLCPWSAPLRVYANADVAANCLLFRVTEADISAACHSGGHLEGLFWRSVSDEEHAQHYSFGPEIIVESNSQDKIITSLMSRYVELTRADSDTLKADERIEFASPTKLPVEVNSIHGLSHGIDEVISKNLYSRRSESENMEGKLVSLRYVEDYPVKDNETIVDLVNNSLESKVTCSTSNDHITNVDTTYATVVKDAIIEIIDDTRTFDSDSNFTMADNIAMVGEGNHGETGANSFCIDDKFLNFDYDNNYCGNENTCSYDTNASKMEGDGSHDDSHTDIYKQFDCSEPRRSLRLVLVESAAESQNILANNRMFEPQAKSRNNRNYDSLKKKVALTGSKLNNTKVSVSPHSSKGITPRKAKCFYCSSSELKLSPHPYVPTSNGNSLILMCVKCINVWNEARYYASRDGELILEGEVNEELCALCSVTPNELILCSVCPRSFCADCLVKVLGPTGYTEEIVESRSDIWKCFTCQSQNENEQDNTIPYKSHTIVNNYYVKTTNNYDPPANLNSRLTSSKAHESSLPTHDLLCPINNSSSPFQEPIISKSSNPTNLHENQIEKPIVCLDRNGDSVLHIYKNIRVAAQHLRCQETEESTNKMIAALLTACRTSKRCTYMMWRWATEDDLTKCTPKLCANEVRQIIDNSRNVKKGINSKKRSISFDCLIKEKHREDPTMNASDASKTQIQIKVESKDNAAVPHGQNFEKKAAPDRIFNEIDHFSIDNSSYESNEEQAICCLADGHVLRVYSDVDEVFANLGLISNSAQTANFKRCVISACTKNSTFLSMTWRWATDDDLELPLIKQINKIEMRKLIDVFRSHKCKKPIRHPLFFSAHALKSQRLSPAYSETNIEDVLRLDPPHRLKAFSLPQALSQTQPNQTATDEFQVADFLSKTEADSLQLAVFCDDTDREKYPEAALNSDISRLNSIFCNAEEMPRAIACVTENGELLHVYTDKNSVVKTLTSSKDDSYNLETALTSACESNLDIEFMGLRWRWASGEDLLVPSTRQLSPEEIRKLVIDRAIMTNDKFFTIQPSVAIESKASSTVPLSSMYAKNTLSNHYSQRESNICKDNRAVTCFDDDGNVIQIYVNMRSAIEYLEEVNGSTFSLELIRNLISACDNNSLFVGLRWRWAEGEDSSVHPNESEISVGKPTLHPSNIQIDPVNCTFACLSSVSLPTEGQVHDEPVQSNVQKLNYRPEYLVHQIKESSNALSNAQVIEKSMIDEILGSTFDDWKLDSPETHCFDEFDDFRCPIGIREAGSISNGKRYADREAFVEPTITSAPLSCVSDIAPINLPRLSTHSVTGGMFLPLHITSSSATSSNSNLLKTHSMSVGLLNSTECVPNMSVTSALYSSTEPTPFTQSSTLTNSAIPTSNPLPSSIVPSLTVPTPNALSPSTVSYAMSCTLSSSSMPTPIAQSSSSS